MNTTNLGPHRCGIVLAGGDGKRLRPFIHSLLGVDLPKQYVSFMGTRSMLQHTIDRAEQLISPECLFTVVARDHLRIPEAHRQLKDRPTHTVVVQPMNRETGPGLLLPLTHLFLRYPNSTVAVFHADHFILQEDLFMDYVRQAFEVIEQYPSQIVFLGMEPTHVEPKYGYVLPENPDLDSSSPLKRVKAFVEKPAPQIASQVTELGALWNTGTMVFRPEVLLHLISLSAPKLHRCFQRIFKALKTRRESAAIEEIYRDMPAVNFSGDLLEALDIHSRNQLFVLSMKDVFWSDWDSEGHILSAAERLLSLNYLPGGFQLDDMQENLPAVLSAAL